MKRLIPTIWLACLLSLPGVSPLAQDEADTPSQNEIYFRTNSAVLDPPYLKVLMTHARFLADNPGRRVRIEGHTDLRGSREYNLALGERRSQNVRQFLIRNGAQPEQIDPVSFGEEIRVERDGDASSMARNRRVALIYDDTYPQSPDA